MQVLHANDMLTHRINNPQNKPFSPETIRRLTEDFEKLYSSVNPLFKHPRPVGSVQHPDTLGSFPEAPDGSAQDRIKPEKAATVTRKSSPLLRGSHVPGQRQQWGKLIQPSLPGKVQASARRRQQMTDNRAGYLNHHKQFSRGSQRHGTAENMVQHLADRGKKPQIQNPTRDSRTDNQDSPFGLRREPELRNLKKTLTRLFRDVREQVQQKLGPEGGVSKNTTETSMWNGIMSSVLDTIKSDVVRAARKLKKDTPNDSEQNPTLANTSTVTRRRFVDQSAPAETINKRTLSKRSPPSSRPPKNPRFNSPGNPSGRSWPPRDSELIQLAAILFSLTIAVIIIFGAARHKTLTARRERARKLAAIRPEKIHTRTDVIHAFHRLIQCQSPDAAEWWNHLQAEASLSQTSPECRQSLQQLTYLYETARYQRKRRTTDQTFIEQARAALSGCLS